VGPVGIAPALGYRNGIVDVVALAYYGRGRSVTGPAIGAATAVPQTSSNTAGKRWRRRSRRCLVRPASALLGVRPGLLVGPVDQLTFADVFGQPVGERCGRPKDIYNPLLCLLRTEPAGRGPQLPNRNPFSSQEV